MTKAAESGRLKSVVKYLGFQPTDAWLGSRTLLLSLEAAPRRARLFSNTAARFSAPFGPDKSPETIPVFCPAKLNTALSNKPTT